MVILLQTVAAVCGSAAILGLATFLVLAFQNRKGKRRR